ncbi:MAG: hypothetical protein WBV85_01205 [Solirubrobacteraceae bacterium]
MEALVGIGTLALAIATFALAWVARRTLGVTQFSVRQSFRPIVVSDTISRKVVYRGGVIHDAAAGPALHYGQLVVPIQNIGAGPALNIRGGAETRDDEVVLGGGWTTHSVEGLGVGHSNAVVFAPQIKDLRPRGELVLRLLYEDLAGLSYATDLHYQDAVVVDSDFPEQPFDKSTSPLSSDELNALLLSNGR